MSCRFAYRSFKKNEQLLQKAQKTPEYDKKEHGEIIFDK